MQQKTIVDINRRINAFAQLGEIMLCLDSDANNTVSNLTNDAFQVFKNEVDTAYLYNNWFVKENVENMVVSLAKSLEKSKLEKWVSNYNFPDYDKDHIKTVAVIMAGNIPLVGFNDLLCVLMSGNRILIKLSSEDARLMPALVQLLFAIEPGFKDYITFADGKIKDFDAVIATGSGNTSRYFDYYFGKYPNIIRKNRNGVAVLNGYEDEKQLLALAEDIFMYFGLGCRNVSKLFVPNKYDFKPLLDILSKRDDIKNHSKYFNNYEYNKAIYLVNGRQHLDTGNILFVEETAYASPVSVLYYEYYDDLNKLNKRLAIDKELIQCVVTEAHEISNSFALGESQSPELMDYADGVDTMEFLLGL